MYNKYAQCSKAANLATQQHKSSICLENLCSYYFI
uniref:Uncharacterized protein n=1 Tax=Anguilla anguilla TaxID=7936 RepID=A0A0E9TW77_ANGAN